MRGESFLELHFHEVVIVRVMVLVIVLLPILAWLPSWLISPELTYLELILVHLGAILTSS